MMGKRVAALLARPGIPLAAALAGLALTLPALGGGLLGDDYIHRSVLLGVGDVGAGTWPVFDLFAFVPQGPRREAALALGTLTWWAHPEISVALLRPLAALTHMLDYALWPDALAVQHLHSLLWYALAIGTVAALYRQVHGTTAVAGLAAVLFAVDDAHAMCAGWLANRHVLIALVFGVVALQAHRRWRRGGGTAWFVAAVAALTTALLCSEAALGAAAYLVAWELTMEDDAWGNRVAALLPYALLIASWRLLYEAFGYGTTGTALYIDPGHHPVDFLLALGARWPILQLAQWAQAPVDVFLLLPRQGQIALGAVSAIVCAGVVWVFVPVVAERREARFWATGMSLSLVPLCAAFPMDRLLLFCGVGAFALLALLAEHLGLLPGRASVCASRRRRFAQALLVVHGPLAAVLLLARVATLPLFAGVFEAGARTAPADANAPRQTYVFVNGQEFPVVYLAIIRQLESPAAAPRRIALLASILNHNDVYREDGDTLVITGRGGFLRESVDQLLRSLDTPFRVGEQIARRDFSAEVRAITADGRPAQVAFHFRAPLESPEFRWLAWGESGVEEFPLPTVGAHVTLPPVGVLPVLGAGRSKAVPRRSWPELLRGAIVGHDAPALTESHR